MRGLRTQSKCGKRIHDDVDPEDLDDGEGCRITQERCEEHKDTGTEVDRELKEDEPLDVLVE